MLSSVELMRNGLTLIRATSSDAPYFYRHWNESGWAIDMEKVREELDPKGEDAVFQYLIKIGEKVVGDVHHGRVDEGRAEIGVFIRDESQRRKGYGFLAIAIMIDHLFERGYERIIFNTAVDNAPMRHIAEKKLGLKPVIHEDVLQELSGRRESYAEYELARCRDSPLINQLFPRPVCRA
ncbi:MAG: GNAT family N-acetyltransferase [Treponema sp.]|nr:GNAT family N-acetyltransferase [Treponema sp.]